MLTPKEARVLEDVIPIPMNLKGKERKGNDFFKILASHDKPLDDVDFGKRVS